MSRAKYLKSLERAVETLKRITNELTRENYELRQLLIAKNASRPESPKNSICAN